jgi:predicted transcriptional regulator
MKKIPKNTPEEILHSLISDLMNGNRDAFYETMTTYLKSVNKEEFSRKYKIPIATLRRVAAGSNFSVQTLFKISRAIVKEG